MARASLNDILAELTEHHAMSAIVHELERISQYQTENWDRENNHRPTATNQNQANTWRSWADLFGRVKQAMKGYPGTRPII